MAELRKCPLCNGEAEQEEWLSECADDSYLKYPAIVCKLCGLTLFGDEHEEFDDIGEDEIKALIELWNTRVTTTEEGRE